MIKIVSLFKEEIGPNYINNTKVEEAFEETASNVAEWEKSLYNIKDSDKLLDKKDLFCFISALFR